jgi:hypothetical protein
VAQFAKKTIEKNQILPEAVVPQKTTRPDAILDTSIQVERSK